MFMRAIIKSCAISIILSASSANILWADDNEIIIPKQLHDGWEVAAPDDVGLDSNTLASLTSAARSGDIQNVHAIIIEKNNKLVYEKYFTGPDQVWGLDIGDDVDFDHKTLHDLRSISKSVTTALLGIALEGDFNSELDRNVTSYFPESEPEFSDDAKEITLFQTLTMTAGLEWNEMTEPYTSGKNDEIAMSFVDKPIEMVLARKAVTPAGKDWYYNGGMTEVVSAIITQKTNLPIDEYAQEALFGPLGIREFEWVGSRRWSSPSAASGLRLTARSLAKIGSVYLNNGKWRDKQIVPKEWIKLSTIAHVPSVPWGDGLVQYGYGFMWYPGKTIDGSDTEIIRAAGWGGQRIFLLPAHDISITVFAGNYRGEGQENDLKILKKITDAITWLCRKVYARFILIL